MSSYRLMSSLLFIVALFAIVSGCASAEKRFEQGAQLESRGQYEDAVMRYVQALEKDPDLDEARIRLREAGDLAIADRLEDAEEWASRGDAPASASHFRRIDGVVARARVVGVRLPLPDDYEPRRRSIFDEAFDGFVERGVMAREQGRWQDGLDAFRRARNEFEPSVDQRNRALTEESTLFVQWSEDEYGRGYLQSAFAVAANVQELEWSPTTQLSRAAALMEDSIMAGEVELIILPVQARAGKRRENSRGAVRSRELAAQIETTLQQGPWRQPPPFVHLHEMLVVRDLITQAGILEGEYRPAKLALILRLAKADFAAYLQLLSSESTEFDVRSRTHTVQTRSGKSTTFIREDGQRRAQAKARVVIADGFGNEIADVIVSGSGTASFARGVYDGNPKELNLSSRQVDLFDRYELEEQEQAVHQALVLDLSANIATAVFQATLAQVP